jgi:hypothetical protein
MSELPVLEVSRDGHTARFHGSWYRGENTNFIPSKAELREPNAVEHFVLHGWLPKAPFIDRHSRIASFGSCFAQYLTEHLHAAGYNALGKHLDLHAHIIRFGEGMVNTFAIRQQLEWVLGDKEMPEILCF